jgi:hypothetical protein
VERGIVAIAVESNEVDDDPAHYQPDGDGHEKHGVRITRLRRGGLGGNTLLGKGAKPVKIASLARIAIRLK